MSRLFGIAALLALLAGVALGGEPTLADLRRRVLEAHSENDIGAALDAVQARIGKDLADAGALGDWLGELPDGRNKHPVVLVRRGWAYVAAKRGADAVPLLEAALKDDPSKGLVRAYLAEAQRQAGDETKALVTLAGALKAGYDQPHVRETAMQCVLWLRKKHPSREAEGLPAYAEAAKPYLQLVKDDAVETAIARALLEDLAAFEKPTSERGQAWAARAGDLLLGLFARKPDLEDGLKLAWGAAQALDEADRKRGGRTARFDLLARAYALGKNPEREGHLLPEVLPALAEAALAEGRWDLAHRLARERLAISESPAARRVLRALPPDVGD